MAFLLPKRVKDLPPLEPDSEDDKTPAKSNKFCLPKEKSMVDKFDTLPFRPIRVSELPPLSDSETDENDWSKDDGFNCALLNESFIMSPSKYDCTPQKYYQNNDKENDKNIVNEIENPKYSIDTGYGDSLQFDFSKLNVNEKITKVTTINNSKDSDNTKVQICSKNGTGNLSSSKPLLLPMLKRQPFSFLNKAKANLLEGNKNLFIEQSEKLKNTNISNNINNLTQGVNVLEKQDFSNPKNRLQFSSASDIISKTQTINAKVPNIECEQPIKQHKPEQSVHHTTTTTNKRSPLNSEIIKKNISPPLLLSTVEKRKPPNALDSISKNMKADIDNTPYKSLDSNFITPNVKPISIQSISRRPIHMGSTQQNRVAIENEFRTQKILFQTPYSVSRPPVLSVSNDSISLGLDDTPSKKLQHTNNIEKKNLQKPITSDRSKSIVKNIVSKKIENNHSKTETDPTKKEKIILINYKEYVVTKKLGSGGSSSVFLAYCKDTKQECALKIVDLNGDRNVVEGYLNETKLLAKLQGNINVVTLFEYEHIQKDRTLYMVMEKGDSDLHKILQSYETGLPLHVLMKFWYQMLQSVLYIHQNGIIHSDLKPANFLMVNGRLKLIDFGIASNIAIDSTSIIKFSQAGTFNYISPEALIDTSTGNSPCSKDKPKIKISTKSDVWSLGCIFYLLMYKRTPFGHIKNIYAKVNLISSSDTVIDYPKLPIYYPPMLIEMTRKCLVHNPKQRLSVAELLKYPFEMIISLDENR